MVKMKVMNDYKELIEHLRNDGGGHFGLKMCYEAADAIEQLVNDRNASVDALKALGENIDVEHVVRCKDCEYWECGPDDTFECGTSAYDFCSFGKRKGGDE